MILVLISSTVAIAVAMGLAFTNLDDLAVPNQSGSTAEPPPIDLADYGPEAAFFNEARSATGIAEAKLPSYVPAGFALESTRTLVQPESSTSMITAIYTRDGKQTADTDDFRSIVKGGALAILYTSDAQDSNRKANWEQVVEQSIREDPQVREKVRINGYTALLVEGDVSKGVFSKAKIFVEGSFIELISLNLSKDELQKVLHSIVTN